MSDIPGTWSTIEIAGKKADIYEPAEPSEHNEVVLALHGHGLSTLKDNPVYSAQFERYGLRAICPHGERSWWGRRICSEFDPQLSPIDFLREHVMGEIARRWSVEPPAVALFGVSMGGQGALRLAYWHPREFPVVAALAPAIDFHNWYGQGAPLDEMYNSSEQARQDTATLHLNPLNWPPHQMIVCDPTDLDWIESSERLASKLSSMGIPFEVDLSTSAGGHSWDYFNHMAEDVIGFIHDRLDRERNKARR